MSGGIIQPSLAAGELSPGLYGRVDLAKYHSAAALARNFFVDYRGGLSNRPGTKFVGRGKAGGTGVVRLKSFTFSTIQAYALEFGHHYMRVVMNGGYVLEPSKVIAIATAANPVVWNVPAHGYVVGDWVYLSNIGVGWAGTFNGKTAIVSAVSDPDHFTLTDLFGNALSALSFPAFTTGSVARIFTLTTPYADTDLFLLKFTQSADTLTVTHPSYVPAQITRTAHYIWTWTAITFAPILAAPTGTAAVPSATGAGTSYNYVVTAISANGITESIASNVGTAANSNTMSITAGTNETVTWAAVAGASYYNIYRQEEVPGSTASAGSLFGFVGTSTGLSFVDNNVLPDFTRTPPLANNPFAAGNNPGSVTYYQSREVFAGSTTGPQTLWMSKTGDFLNMDYSIPTRDDDSIVATIVSQKMDAIKHLVPMNSLIALTANGAWRIDGGSQSDVITPSHFVATPQSFNGASDVPPLVINYDILYVQAKGSTIRDLAYNFYVNVYTGVDISMLANHLFYGHSIVDWDWAEEPYKLVWAIRDDGIFLTLTYLKEQEVYGWTRHDTLGMVKSVCVVSEGSEYAVYFVIMRKINGTYIPYIERLASRNFEDNIIGTPNPPWFVDCGLQYPLTYLNATCTPAKGWDVSGAPVLFQTDNAVFTAGMVGNLMQINGGSGTITSFIDSRNVMVALSHPLTDIFPSAANDWACTAPIQTISGLDHLPGQTLVGLADGNVVTGLQVANGQVALPVAASNVVLGLPYRCQIQSLYLATGETPTEQGKRKDISAVTVRCYNTRGLWVGPHFWEMTENKERSVEPYYLPAPIGDPSNMDYIKMVTAAGDPIPLFTGDRRINIEDDWDTYGQFCIEIRDPVPATILALIPEINEGDTP